MGSFRISGTFALILSLGAVLVLSGLMGWLYTRGALFRVEKIEVIGASAHLEPEIRALTLPIMGQGFFGFSLRALREKIARNPKVRDALIQRRWPNKIKISLVEKSPAAALVMNGQYWILDEKCKPIEILQRPQVLIPIRTVVSVPAHICQFFLDIEAEDTFFKKEDFTFASWDNLKGLSLISENLELTLKFGLLPDLKKWKRLNTAYKFLKERQINVTSLDAAFSQRVLFVRKSANILRNLKESEKLQNPQNRLTLKEMERRASQGIQGDQPALAR